MKKVYLFCNAGMSTSLVANKMQEVADQYKLPMEIKAFTDSSMDEVVARENPDVILLGPQVKYRLKDTEAKHGADRPVAVIDQQDYGKADGERVLKASIKLMKDFKKGENK